MIRSEMENMDAADTELDEIPTITIYDVENFDAYGRAIRARDFTKNDRSYPIENA